MQTPARRVDPVRQHRRAVLYKIILPVILVCVLLLAFAVILVAGTAAGSLESKQVSIIMGVLLTAFIMVPTVLLCLIPCALLIAAAYGTGWVYAQGKQPLRTVRQLSTRIMHKTDELAPKASAPFVALNVRATRWEHLLRGLCSPTPSDPTQPEKQ